MTLEDARDHLSVQNRTQQHDLLWGAIGGGVAAILYTTANIALRYCVGVDPFFVAAVKAFPTVAILGPFLIWMIRVGHPPLTSRKMLPRFVVVAVLGQFVGNAAFQVALQIIGLAASVPITLGVMIIGGGVLGWVILREPVRLPTVVAIVILISAVFLLSSPGSTTRPPESANASPLWLGALCAAASGLAYALFGTVMRQTLNGGVSASLAMFISGVVGLVSLSIVAVVRIGLDQIAAATMDQWGIMMAAGVLNFSAFVALSYALKKLPVVAVNLINASQVALAATAAVLFFAEPITGGLIAGILMTFLGLAVFATKRPNGSPAKIKPE